MHPKPIFVFAKMPWCGHCVKFDSGQWQILAGDEQKHTHGDPELKKVVDLERIIWNSDRQRGAVLPLPEKYRELITYGPFFWLEAGVNAKGKPIGVEVKVAPVNGERTAASVKAAILHQLNTNPIFARATAVTATPVPAGILTPTPGAAPRRQVVAATVTRPGAASIAAPARVPTKVQQRGYVQEPAAPTPKAAELSARLSKFKAPSPAGRKAPAEAQADNQDDEDTPQIVAKPKKVTAKIAEAKVDEPEPTGPRFSYKVKGAQPRRALTTVPASN
jgi:hypothetical protein